MRTSTELLRAGDPRLSPTADPAAARALLEAYRPGDSHQADERARMLAFLDAHPDALLRSCVEGHLTASSLILDAAGEHSLLTHHRKLGKWLQLGGHCDGDGNLPAVALREATEESGLDGLAIDPRPIDLDVHVIPARPGEPAHLHLDTRFVVHAPPGAEPRKSHESLELAWFRSADLERIETDGSVTRLFRIVLGD